MAPRFSLALPSLHSDLGYPRRTFVPWRRDSGSRRAWVPSRCRTVRRTRGGQASRYDE
ncbi:hypothetical protein POX_f07614 [Penicillium oxalicum]|uniref:Uncharacterized protein n=1 Tax=Penicillium oxalicum (strain 114-2 / CGMCC 5302) TaxID=933388 RepID=S7ZIK7_PENO1|nr:hypothetical protein POX_f07614 [Penicillium oxalicum]EPS28531.1 hypothetical protein PDE_03477 [Penicillium oxalicum 114-2]KAI2787251.1 hypothetical protein POX_f07614 [Penicillium oxalicum]